MKINTTKTLIFTDMEKEMTVLLHGDRASFSIGDYGTPGAFFNVDLPDLREFYAHLGLMINGLGLSYGLPQKSLSQAEIVFADGAKAPSPLPLPAAPTPPATTKSGRVSKKLFADGGRKWPEETLLKAGRLLMEGLNYAEVGKHIARSGKAVYHQHKKGNISNCPYSPNEMKSLAGSIGALTKSQNRQRESP